MEWAIAVCLEFNLTVAATMCIGPGGSKDGATSGECAVRMARAGAYTIPGFFAVTSVVRFTSQVRTTSALAMVPVL